MEDKLDINLEINELQLNLVDLVLQANTLKDKYEERKNKISFKVFNINKLQESEYYIISESNLTELNKKFEDYKNDKNESSKLDMFKIINDEFDFIKEDLNLIKTFENVVLDEEIFVYNYVKLIFIEKTIELITQIILEMNA